MKLSMQDLVFYVEFSPPRDGEKHGDFTKRRTRSWDECLVSYDKEDVTQFHELARQLYFNKEKRAVDAPALTGADLLRQAIAAERERLRELPIHYSGTFDAHLFTGEADGNKHKGLHSLFRLLGTAGLPTLEVIVRDEHTGAYSAWATLPGNTGRKASSFFPDAWDVQRVKAAIKEAFIDARLNPAFSSEQSRNVGLTWVGRANVDGRELMIGGLGDGNKPMSGIATAFPAVNGEFRDYN